MSLSSCYARFSRAIVLGWMWLFLPDVAHAQAVSSPFEEGQQAYATSELAEALAAFERVEPSDSLFAEAQYMVAKIYLDSTYLAFGRAESALKKALQRDRRNVKYRELDLLRQHMRPFPFLPTLFASRRALMAKRLLRLDPENELAHRVLGTVYSKDYMNVHGARNLGGDMDDVILDMLPTATDVVIASSDSSNASDQVAFQDQQNTGVLLNTVSQEAQATRLYNKTRHHLLRAMRSDPTIKETYATLMKVAAVRKDQEVMRPMLRSMAQHFVDDVDFWLYRGFAEYKRGDFADATISFDTAIDRMPPDEQAAYLDIETFLNEVQRNLYQTDSLKYASVFWDERDPRLLTSENERELEHYARMVYADLRFGAMKKGRRGWLTEPGQVVVRYGEPVTEINMASAMDKYLVFHYGDLQFVFMDLAKAGNFTFYSPGASGPSFRGPTKWQGDYVIKSRETFRELPERFRYDYQGRRVEVPFLVSSFKGDNGKADVVVPFGIPFSQTAQSEVVGAPVKSGVFLLAGNEGVYASDRQNGDVVEEQRLLPFSAGNMWSSLHHVEADAGAYTLAVEFDMRTPIQAAGFERFPLEVVDYYTPELHISDVLLAYQVEATDAPDGYEGAYLVRDGLELHAAPWGVFRVGQPIYLYFELYNLTTNAGGKTSYDVEAVIVENKKERPWEKLVKRAFRRADDGVSIRFPGQGTSPEESQSFVMDSASLEPGTYALIVRVTDKAIGKTVERGRTILIEGDRPTQ